MVISLVKTIRNKIHTTKNTKKYLKVMSFLSPDYQQINVARLQHLESLGLDLWNKSVIEFGAGIGDHTFYYLLKNCTVLPTDGRKELTEYIAKRFNIKTMQLDIEKNLCIVKTLPRFDIIHCYGILYHISNPEEFLNSIKNLGDLLLLETCVSISKDDFFVYEKRTNPTQAIGGIGCRPTREWIYEKLKQNYTYVYLPLTQPKHKEFPTSWPKKKSKKHDELTRCVFIASNNPIKSKLLTQKVINQYKNW